MSYNPSQIIFEDKKYILKNVLSTHDIVPCDDCVADYDYGLCRTLKSIQPCGKTGYFELDKSTEQADGNYMQEKKQLDPTEGRKFDSDKPQYGLLPPNALRDVVDVLTFGAKKYAPDNWKYVDNGMERYFDAAQRHMWAWKAGEQNDPETGKNHLAHALCCLMFMTELDKGNETKK